MWGLLARKRFGFALRLWLLRIKYALVTAEVAHVGTCAPPGWKRWAPPAVFRDTISSAGWAESMWECLLAFPKQNKTNKKTTSQTAPRPPKKKRKSKPQIEAYVIYLKQTIPYKKISLWNRIEQGLVCHAIWHHSNARKWLCCCGVLVRV